MESWASKHQVEYTPLDVKQPLPSDVHVLTLNTRDSVSDDVILRLQSLDVAPAKANPSPFNLVSSTSPPVEPLPRPELSVCLSVCLHL